MRRAFRLAAVVAALALVTASAAVPPAHLNAAKNPISTPAGMVRFYFHALNTGQCDLAFKFADRRGQSLSTFRRNCRTITHVAIERLDDPGFRLHPQTAVYTCLAVRYTIYRRSGPAAPYGGWYLMERTLGPAWSILYPLSHVTRGGRAVLLTREQCASHLPSYVQPGSGTVISGSAFLSGTRGWTALSTSGSYLPNGSCNHGIGSNCESASTAVYRTEDAGRRWTPLLRVTTAVGPPVWIRLFNRQVGMVAATVGPLKASANYRFSSVLFSTHDGGRHWQRFPLPVDYATQSGSITFPDPRHGWLWYGGAAMGSMSLYLYRTSDGGQHWSRVACTDWSIPPTRSGCPNRSGIGLGGDKTDLTFIDAHNGWLTAYENGGVPDIYYTSDGGVSWRRQGVGLPSGVALPTAKSTVFPSGTLLQPTFFGRIGLLPETVGFYRSKPRASWSRLYMFRSTDGGRTWPSVLRTPVSGDVTLWQALDGRHWVFLTTSSLSLQTVWETKDGGVSWTQNPLGLRLGLVLVGLQLPHEGDGWATAQRHGDSQVSMFGTVLLHTRDGGAHWTDVRLPE